jgi:hypothetical protein
MYYQIAADLVVLLHLGFIGFAVAGGLLVLKWRSVAAIHIPAAVWGALVELQGWYCPLTPLEQYLRREGGQGAYSGGFVQRYLMPVLYPADLDREMQMLLGAAVIAINLVLYAWVVIRLQRRHKRD